MHVLPCGDGDASFEWRLRTLCGGRGVDVVLGGTRLANSMECVRDWGRVLHHGRADMLAGRTIGEQGYHRLGSR